MPANPFDFTGRTALVTGCGSAEGIGFATARLLARVGASVAITSTTDRIEQRAEELRADGATVSAHVADLTDRAQAFELVATAQVELGPVEILVNAAGMVQTGTAAVSAPFRDLSPDHLHRELEITLKTAFHTTQAALPAMVERRSTAAGFLPKSDERMILTPKTFPEKALCDRSRRLPTLTRTLLERC